MVVENVLVLHLAILFFNIFLFNFLFFWSLFLWEGCDVFRNKSKFCFFLNLTGHFITFCYCNNRAQGLIFLRKKMNWV